MNDKLKALFTELKTTTMLYAKVREGYLLYWDNKCAGELKKLEKEIEEIQLKIVGAVKEEEGE